MPLEEILAATAILLILGVFASKASGRLGVPALLLFLGLGMLAGSEGIGGIYFDDVTTAEHLGIVALAFLLFAGGLETNWEFVRDSVKQAVSLATIGVLVTTAIVGYFVHVAVGVTLLQGMLLGAIVSSTDAAAVFSILRASGVRLRHQVAAILELESGSNDPMAVFLTTAFLALIMKPRTGFGSLSLDFVQQMAPTETQRRTIRHERGHVDQLRACEQADRPCRCPNAWCRNAGGRRRCRDPAAGRHR